MKKLFSNVTDEEKYVIAWLLSETMQSELQPRAWTTENIQKEIIERFDNYNVEGVDDAIVQSAIEGAMDTRQCNLEYGDPETIYKVDDYGFTCPWCENYISLDQGLNLNPEGIHTCMHCGKLIDVSPKTLLVATVIGDPRGKDNITKVPEDVRYIK